MGLFSAHLLVRAVPLFVCERVFGRASAAPRYILTRLSEQSAFVSIETPRAGPTASCLFIFSSRALWVCQETKFIVEQH